MKTILVKLQLKTSSLSHTVMLKQVEVEKILTEEMGIELVSHKGLKYKACQINIKFRWPSPWSQYQRIA